MKKLAILGLSLLLMACGGDDGSPEAQIKAIIADMEAAAEARNRRGVSERISEDFSSPEGGSKKEVNNLIRAYLLRNQSINIVTVIHAMQAISSQEYRVDLSAFMAAKSVDLNSEAGRLKADRHRFNLTFVDDSGKGDWKLRSATWNR